MIELLHQTDKHKKIPIVKHTEPAFRCAFLRSKNVKKVVAFFSVIKYNFANGKKPYIFERMLINEKDQTMLVIDPNGGYAAERL